MSTFSLRRAHQKIKEREQEPVMEEVVEEVVEEKEEVVKDVFVCPHCSREYKTKRGLDKHIETKHKDGE